MTIAVGEGWMKVTRLDDGDGDEDGGEPEKIHADCDEDDCDGGLWTKQGTKVCDECYTMHDGVSEHSSKGVFAQSYAYDNSIGPHRDEDRDEYYHSKNVILPGAGNGTDFWDEV